VQEGEIRRVGDTVTRNVDVRIIAATNKLLQDEVKEQRFREDLYYRLNVIPIHIPPLRERRDDIPYLVQYFIKRFTDQLQSPVRNISEELMDVFVNAEWRGNVRELENTIHRMMVFANSEILTSKNLPSDYAYKEKHIPQILQKSAYSPHYTLNQMLKEHIAAVLKSTDGNKTEAAKVLGMKRTTLIQKMKKLKMM
jgi:transcriptional regulator with PAS, ATPase and Fis domain